MGVSILHSLHLLQLITQVEVINQRTQTICAKNKQRHKHLDNNIGCGLLGEQVVNAVDTPTQEGKTNERKNHSCKCFKLLIINSFHKNFSRVDHIAQEEPLSRCTGT